MLLGWVHVGMNVFVFCSPPLYLSRFMSALLIHIELLILSYSARWSCQQVLAVLEKTTCPPPVEKVPDEPKGGAAQSVHSAQATAKSSSKSKVKKKKASKEGSKAVENKDTPPCSEKVARVAAFLGQALAHNVVAEDLAGSQDGYKPGEFNEGEKMKATPTVRP